jgi:hypothetical protein
MVVVELSSILPEALIVDKVENEGIFINFFDPAQRLDLHDVLGSFEVNQDFNFSLHLDIHN